MRPGETHLRYRNTSRFTRRPRESEHPVDLEMVTHPRIPALSWEPPSQNLPLPGWDMLPPPLLVSPESKRTACSVVTSPCVPREASSDPHLAT